VSPVRSGRTWVDWLIVLGATAILVGFATIARAPQIPVHWGWVLGLTILMAGAMVACGLAIWRTTRFA
jgi:hypothetical protein